MPKKIDTVNPSNGSLFYLGKEWMDDAEPWAQEILKLFLKEFGNGPYISSW